MEKYLITMKGGRYFDVTKPQMDRLHAARLVFKCSSGTCWAWHPVELHGELIGKTPEQVEKRLRQLMQGN
jgi:hypothetical protein